MENTKIRNAFLNKKIAYNPNIFESDLDRLKL